MIADALVDIDEGNGRDAYRQRGGSVASLAATLLQEARQQCSGSSGGLCSLPSSRWWQQWQAVCWQRNEAGMAAAAATTTVLPLRAAMAAMKTPAVTAMAGAHATINDQLKAATAMEKWRQ